MPPERGSLQRLSLLLLLLQLMMVCNVFATVPTTSKLTGKIMVGRKKEMYSHAQKREKKKKSRPGWNSMGLFLAPSAFCKCGENIGKNIYHHTYSLAVVCS